jgi:hypothetical protein
MRNFTFIILLTLVAFCSYVSGVTEQYRSYKESAKYVGYSDFAILVDAMKNEANLQLKVLSVFAPVTLIIDLLIILLK